MSSQFPTMFIDVAVAMSSASGTSNTEQPMSLSRLVTFVSSFPLCLLLPLACLCAIVYKVVQLCLSFSVHSGCQWSGEQPMMQIGELPRVWKDAWGDRADDSSCLPLKEGDNSCH
jgi:hypothetical protein